MHGLSVSRADQISEMLKTFRKTLRDSLSDLGYDVRRRPRNQFLWLRQQNIRTILDVGAFVGTFAEEFHELLPEAAIYSFEPLHDCYEQLTMNLSRVEKFRAFNCALGNQNGEVVIHRNLFAPSSSLRPMTELHRQAFPFAAREVAETVQVRRLDDLADEMQFADEALIKLDVQGFEDQVIAGGRKTIARARVMIVEVSFQPLYQGQPLFEEIQELLREFGFRFRGFLGDQTFDPADGSVLFADAIFLRE